MKPSAIPRIQKLVQKPPKSYVHNASSTPLLYETVGDRFAQAVEKTPDKELFVFRAQNIRKTYQEVYQDARNLAKGLVHLGVRKGDRVGIWGPNYYEWTVTQYATAMAGFILVNVNPAYQTNELRYALQKVGVKALITPPAYRKSNYYKSLCSLIPQLTQSHGGAIHDQHLTDFKHLIMFQRNGQHFHGTHDFEEILTAGGSNDEYDLDAFANSVRPDDDVNIQFTSGTTGYPKAATLSHFGIVNNAVAAGFGLGFHQAEARLGIPNPLYHCFGNVLGSLATVAHNATAVFPAEYFDAGAVCAAIHEERLTCLYGTPTMFVDVLAHPRFKDVDTSSLSTGLMSGAPCPRALCEHLVSVGVARLHVAYGSTELSPLVAMTRVAGPPHSVNGDRGDIKNNNDTNNNNITNNITNNINNNITNNANDTENINNNTTNDVNNNNVGHALPHVELCVRDADGGDVVVGRGVRGELCARGYMVMHGYWADAESTARVLGPDRWYRTGDIGIMNEDDSVTICGRAKELIIRGGENIYPAEIEQFLFKHEAVEDVYVVGIPDDRFGEEICAVVRLKEGRTASADQIRDFCRGQIAHYKVPRYVCFKTEAQLPQTATGKIQKFKLKAICEAELLKNSNGTD